MLLQRGRPAGQSETAAAAQQQQRQQQQQAPKLEQFLESRDFTGAMVLLQFQRQAKAHMMRDDKSGKRDPNSGLDPDLWIAYCAFHLGDYKRALDEFEQVSKRSQSSHQDLCVYKSCCYFMLGMYKEADEAAQRGSKTQLRNRVLFHLSQKFNDEVRLLGHHQQLQDQVEDQLSLASIHYLRGHYQEAIDIYKRLILDYRDYLAVNVYLALCYYKLDYYDVSQELLSVYLQQFPDSVTAVNLKACNQFKLFNGRGAEQELLRLQELASPNFSYAMDLIKHNLVVFRGGQGALQVLPSLIDVLPEARLNLVIYHLRLGDCENAFALMKDLEPTTPQEYILKAVVNADLGQKIRSREHLNIAKQYFQLVGGSASECDTIPGRQCMSSCFFLLRQFSDVLVYLNSIKSFFSNDDAFNFNFAQAQASVGHYKEAEETFQLIQSQELRQDYVYLSWLSRCYIRNRKPNLAWEIYLQLESSTESFSLLWMIANDCYTMGHFYFAAKAFDLLGKFDSDPAYFRGKCGACVGVVQQIAAGSQPPERLSEIVQMLRNERNSSQVELIISQIKKWATANHFTI